MPDGRLKNSIRNTISGIVSRVIMIVFPFIIREVLRLNLDNAKLKRLGFTVELNLEKGISETNNKQILYGFMA